VKFEPWHLTWLALQPSQQQVAHLLTRSHGSALQYAGPCFTAFAGRDVIACAGICKFWEGRAQVWSMLSPLMGTYKKTIHKAVKTFIQNYRVTRLECVVDPRNDEAVRWARHLGFRFEGTMEAYTPAGEDQVMFVRIERG
jgi:RimJ/RimL family protein N-acetyltransferase